MPEGDPAQMLRPQRLLPPLSSALLCHWPLGLPELRRLWEGSRRLQPGAPGSSVATEQGRLPAHRCPFATSRWAGCRGPAVPFPAPVTGPWLRLEGSGTGTGPVPLGWGRAGHLGQGRPLAPREEDPLSALQPRPLLPLSPDGSGCSRAPELMRFVPDLPAAEDRARPLTPRETAEGKQGASAWQEPGLGLTREPTAAPARGLVSASSGAMVRVQWGWGASWPWMISAPGTWGKPGGSGGHVAPNTFRRSSRETGEAAGRGWVGGEGCGRRTAPASPSTGLSTVCSPGAPGTPARPSTRPRCRGRLRLLASRPPGSSFHPHPHPRPGNQSPDEQERRVKRHRAPCLTPGWTGLTPASAQRSLPLSQD